MDLAFFPTRVVKGVGGSGDLAGGMGGLGSSLMVGLIRFLLSPKVLQSVKGVSRVNDLITEWAQEAIARGWKQGFEKGFKEGFKQGFEEGKAEGRL